MGDAVIASILISATFVVVVGLHAYRWLSWRNRQSKSPYAFLVESFAFDRSSERRIADTRVTRYSGRFRGMRVTLERGDSDHDEYLRIHIRFEDDLEFGVRISSEHEDDLMVRLKRMREMQIGSHHFDSEFLLLSRDEERMKQLLDHDTRRMLMQTRKSVKGMRLDDIGLHLHVVGEKSREALTEILDGGVQLCDYVARRAEDVLAAEAEAQKEQEGPVPAFTPVPGTMTSISGERKESAP